MHDKSDILFGPANLLKKTHTLVRIRWDAKQVEDLKNILCALAKEASNKNKLLMKRYFATACNYELLFWDMAYNSTTA
jgi:hypothetical protein